MELHGCDSLVWPSAPEKLATRGLPVQTWCAKVQVCGGWGLSFGFGFVEHPSHGSVPLSTCSVGLRYEAWSASDSRSVSLWPATGMGMLQGPRRAA